MRAFILHGSFGNPDENWIPWLKGQVRSQGIEVVTPVFPTPKGQSLASWWQVFEPELQKLDSQSLLIGHSLGATFALRILEKVSQPIAGTFLIATVGGNLGNPEFDSINETFYDEPFDWKLIKQNAGRIFVYHSESDPYIPVSMANDTSEKLGVKLINIPKAGHFNEDSGYTKFPELWKDVKLLNN